MIDIRAYLSEVISREIITPSEASKILGVSKAAISNMKARGKLVPIKEAQGNALYLRSDIQAYKQKRCGSVKEFRLPDELHMSTPLLLFLCQENDLETLLNSIKSADFLGSYALLNEENKKLINASITAMITVLLTKQEENTHTTEADTEDY